MRTINRADISPSVWSGGRTWEFYLAPEDGSYAERRFELRISSASVETSSSDFTALPGIDRWLAVCQPITLTINGNTQTLGPGQVVAFRGEDAVSSVGSCQDLNVMARRGSSVEVAWADTHHGPCLVLTADAERCLVLDDGETATVAGLTITT